MAALPYFFAFTIPLAQVSLVIAGLAQLDVPQLQLDAL